MRLVVLKLFFFHSPLFWSGILFRLDRLVWWRDDRSDDVTKGSWQERVCPRGYYYNMNRDEWMIIISIWMNKTQREQQIKHKVSTRPLKWFVRLFVWLLTASPWEFFFLCRTICRISQYNLYVPYVIVVLGSGKRTCAAHAITNPQNERNGDDFHFFCPEPRKTKSKPCPLQVGLAVRFLSTIAFCTILNYIYY